MWGAIRARLLLPLCSTARQALSGGPCLQVCGQRGHMAGFVGAKYIDCERFGNLLRAATCECYAKAGQQPTPELRCVVHSKPVSLEWSLQCSQRQPNS